MKKTAEKISNHEFDSTMIVKSSYNHTKNVLTVEFKGGKCYNYYNVDEDTFNKFVYSDSQGTFFNNNIKDKFDFKSI